MEPTGVGVVGLGTMGSGIACACAQAGLSVVAVETTTDRLEAGRSRTRTFLDGSVERGKLDRAEVDPILTRVRGVTSLDDLAGVQLVIEAVSEDPDLKRRVLAAVAEVAPKDAVIATNTSAISVTKLAAAVDTPGRFGGLHFFNPAQLMPLVEVVGGVQSTEQTLETLETFARRLGKEPIRVKDRPGFLVNRLLIPYLNQAVSAYDNGIASAADIDVAVELGLGYPMGPLKLLELIGLDVHLHATTAAYEELQEAAFAPPPLLRRLVDAGASGVKAPAGASTREPSS
jgi:3-hydroxybutyryl-CoA dehydrogenase